MVSIVKMISEICKDGVRIGIDLDTSGCLMDYAIAMELCGRDSFLEGLYREPAEFVPVSIESCVEATAALRRCMQGNPDVYREHIVAMDRGIEEEERRRREPDMKVEEEDTRFRWWTGLRNC